jgi:hypothetical protein
MPTKRQLVIAAYHEAGHGAAVEYREHKVTIVLEQDGKWDPTTVAIPNFPNKGDKSAEVAIAGPIAEALAECNYDEPDHITSQIWLASPGNQNKWVQFGKAVIASRGRRGIQRMKKLHLQMTDTKWHHVYVSAKEYEHVSDNYDCYAIAALVQRMAKEVQDDWSNVHRIAAVLQQRKKYKTRSFGSHANQH